MLHIDMDAFFASVELLERPELRDKPVVVGGTGPRAVVTAANYIARKYGVNSAMPMSVALRRCPNAVVLKPHGEKYRHYSAIVMGIFNDMTPLVEPLSIDEAFLDVSGARRLHGSPAEIGASIRQRVHAETGLSCSVGIAATKFVAKVASGKAKPDGLLVVPASQTLAFLHPLPVNQLWGVGAATEASLRRLGLNTIGDVAATPMHVLQKAVGVAGAGKLSLLANGIDTRSVVTERQEKSIGHEITFTFDVFDENELRRELLRLAGDVASRLRKHGVLSKTIVFKLRHPDFTTLTRSRTLAEPTDVGRRVYEEALIAFEALHVPGTGVRLLGIRGEQLEPSGGGALSLWDPDEDWRGVERAVDGVTARFGSAAMAPAALLGRGSVRPETTKKKTAD